MEVLRTPDECFAGLLDYSFQPHYVEIVDAAGPRLRVHYVDEGPRDAAPILLMHGDPAWSYLYRKMIPPLAARGHRVLAPDLIGFGRSDKPAARSDYTYERHVDWMSAWLIALDLTGVTLFCHAWGGLIGLRMVARHAGRFAAVIAANTALPAAGGYPPLAVRLWLAGSRLAQHLPVGWMISNGSVRGLSKAERRAYEAPFPGRRYKAGARRLPTLLPIMPSDASATECRQAWIALAQFSRPFVTAFSDGDPITRGLEHILQDRIRGARGQPHRTIKNARHYLQEDKPEELVELIDSVASSR